MSDFYRILKAQQEMEAQELALSLELFVEGSLNIFNHHTNVDVDNRFTVYGIQDLGSQLAPVAMLVMMEAIQQRILDNAKRGRATWLYIDECHVLLGSEYSAKSIYSSCGKRSESRAASVPESARTCQIYYRIILPQRCCLTVSLWCC